MKRVRGVDEVVPPGAVTSKHSSIGGATNVGSGGANLNYHSSCGIGILSGQTVRSIASKEMPGSIQFGTNQTPQYTGAIVPTASSPVKVNKPHTKVSQTRKSIQPNSKRDFYLKISNTLFTSF